MQNEPAQHRSRLLLIENSLHTTGALASALHLSQALRNTHEVEFVIPSSSSMQDEVTAAGLVCHKLPMTEIGRSWRKLLVYLPMLLINTVRLRKLLSQRKIDALIVNDYYNLLGVGIRVTGWNKPIVTMVRLLPANQHPIMNKLWTMLGLLFTDRLVGVSKAVVRQLPTHSKVSVLYNPINFFEKYPQSLLREASADGLVHCLYPANYIAGKGHDTALEAFAIAWKHFPALRLRFIGGDMGLEKNRKLKRDLELKAERLEIQNVVTIDGFSSDVELDVKNADIVLNFSQSESLSHTCVEASMFGRPVIATRCGGPEEVIDHNRTGLLVELGDIPGMAEAILKLANSSTKRIEMGKAGRVYVREKFCETTCRHEFIQLLEMSTEK